MNCAYVCTDLHVYIVTCLHNLLDVSVGTTLLELTPYPSHSVCVCVCVCVCMCVCVYVCVSGDSA